MVISLGISAAEVVSYTYNLYLQLLTTIFFPLIFTFSFIILAIHILQGCYRAGINMGNGLVRIQYEPDCCMTIFCKVESGEHKGCVVLRNNSTWSLFFFFLSWLFCEMNSTFSVSINVRGEVVRKIVLRESLLASSVTL